MAPLARYPDAQSPYWIERRNGSFNVHHERLGLVAECDCLQEARHQISDAEDEAEAAAAQEAREIAEAESLDDLIAGLELTETICSEIIAARKAA